MVYQKTIHTKGKTAKDSQIGEEKALHVMVMAKENK